MLENYKVVDLPKVSKLIHIGELEKLPPSSIIIVEIDTEDEDVLNDHVDLFGSINNGHHYVVINKGVDVKLVIDNTIKSINTYSNDDVPEAPLELPKTIDDMQEADLPQFGERNTELWENEYRAFNNRPQ